MKLKIQFWKPLCATAMVAAGMLASVSKINAQLPDLDVNTFDNDTSAGGFWLWWGGIQREFAWDSTVDAGGNANSGSAKLSFTYDNSNGDNQYCVGMSLAGTSAYNGSLVAFPSDYTALEFDLLWDTNSTVTVDEYNNSGGDPAFNMGLAGVVASPGGTVDWGGGSISWISPSPTLTGGGTWQHVVVPLPLTKPGFAGLAFKKWQPTSAGGLNGTVAFWLDNFRLIGAAPPTPPTLTLQRTLNEDGAYLLSWTVPDAGFRLVTKSNLTTSPWYVLDVPITQIGSLKQALIGTANLPSPGQGYFQLVNTNSP
jgi:hypothetical protein